MNDIKALFMIIDVYHRVDKLKQIKVFIESLIDIIPKNTLGFDVISYAYYKAKDYKLAIKYGELALGGASTEEAKAIRFNLGKCYLNANEPIKSRNCFEVVCRIAPERVDVRLDLAAALYACNQKDAANELLLSLNDDTSALDPKDAMAVAFNLGTHFIRSGDFKRGMQNLSLGRQLRIWGSYSHKYPIPEWDGVTTKGMHVLIVGEGGIGDEIINARFVKHINDKGMKASFASCQNLDSILSRMPFVNTNNYVKFTTDIKNISTYDCWVPAMNLPTVLGVELNSLWYGQYLTPSEEHNKKWSEILTGDFKVGLRWSGNPLYEQDLHRSISLDAVYKVIPKTWTKYSIQKENTEVLKPYNDIVNLEDRLETFEDALGCINNLDVVITSCTSVAHAAAAMNKQVFIMVPIMDYYVWAEGNSKSSWYGDNVTLIRQTVPKSWDSAMIELGEHLTKI